MQGKVNYVAQRADCDFAIGHLYQIFAALLHVVMRRQRLSSYRMTCVGTLQVQGVYSTDDENEKQIRVSRLLITETRPQRRRAVEDKVPILKCTM